MCICYITSLLHHNDTNVLLIKTTTVKSPLVDPPNKGHNRNNLSRKDASHPKCSLSHSGNTISTSNGQNGWS